jgi:hypothetical protein
VFSNGALKNSAGVLLTKVRSPTLADAFAVFVLFVASW